MLTVVVVHHLLADLDFLCNFVAAAVVVGAAAVVVVVEHLKSFVAIGYFENFDCFDHHLPAYLDVALLGVRHKGSFD